MKEQVLATRALTKEYERFKAVDRVDMTIGKGDIYGFIGENGAGKTTLIRLITGLVHPTSGDISLFGQTDYQGLTQSRKRISCIVEAPAFFPKLTAEQNLEYYRIQRGIPDKKLIHQSLELAGLPDTGKKRYSDFSLGMKQRLGLALALMNRPDFLVLDEPINGLDPKGIIEFRSTIKDLQQARNMTILISSHILSELSQVATRFGIIHKGKLIKEISQEKLEMETKRCLMVRVDDSAHAATVLQEQLDTTDFEVLPNHVLRVYGFLDNPSEVTFQLSTHGIRVLSAAEQGVDLEDYFLHAIGETPQRRAL